MHEQKDLNVRAVVWFGAALLTVGVLIHLAVGAQFFAYQRAEERTDPPPHPLAASPALPPPPRLEVAPRQ